MNKTNEAYDRAVRSQNDSDQYAFSGESEYSRERSDPYLMVDYMLDKGFIKEGDESHLKEDIEELLARDMSIESSQIDVEVTEGVVFLRGHVDSLRARRLAEMTVENFSGVKNVINQLTF